MSILDERFLISLKCKDCDNSECKFNLPTSIGQCGCVKEVDEELYVNYDNA